MIMTFDDYSVEIICNSLEHALNESYNIIDFFTFDPDLDPWGDAEE